MNFHLAQDWLLPFHEALMFLVSLLFTCPPFILHAYLSIDIIIKAILKLNMPLTSLLTEYFLFRLLDCPLEPVFFCYLLCNLQWRFNGRQRTPNITHIPSHLLCNASIRSPLLRGLGSGGDRLPWDRSTGMLSLRRNATVVDGR